MYKKIKDDLWVNFEDQTFIRLKMPRGRTINTSYGVLKVYNYREFLDAPNGTMGVIFDFCEEIKKIKRTVYAKFTDFEYIAKGRRPIRSAWIDFLFNFQPLKAYSFVAKRDNDFPANMNILKTIEIKKKYE